MQNAETKIWTVFRQAVVYASVGLMSMALDIAFFSLLTLVIGIHYLLANIISFVGIGSLNFLANRRFTFNHRGRPEAKQYSKFFIVACIGLLINTALLAFFVESLALHKVLAKFFAAVITFFWNFGMNRSWTFRA